MNIAKIIRPALLVLAAPVAAFAADEEITYAKHIAPIFQDKCQECHQPNSIAPVSFMDYRDVLKEARSIKHKVESRIMPPWHIDTSVGIQEFKNDRGLSDEEIDMIVRWVDNEAPLGDPADMPPPREFPDPTAWQLANDFGEPDLIVKSEPFTLAAETQDKWFRPIVDAGLTEPRWVKAVEIRPSFPEGRQVVHHTLTYLIQEEEGVTGLASSAAGVQRTGGMFMEWAVGKVGEIFPPDAGKLLLPGVKFRWEVHYHAMGKEVVDDQVEMGIWFYPRDHVPKYRTVLKYFDITHGGKLDIRPNEIAVTQQYYVLAAPARLENFQPHMHMRGKAMRMEAVYPDGRTELLSQVDNFQWNWHINYVYKEDAAPLLPKGTTLVFTAWHDNTEDNPNNPDPEQWVGWGDRTVDEMAHAWVDVTYLEQEDYEAMLAERGPAKIDEGG
jgi:mono/diheme cytochrome c family protein